MKFKALDTVNQRIERITTSHLVIGIDIAKETHVARAVNFRGLQLGKALSFTNNEEGFGRLQRWSETLLREHRLSSVIVGLESTGHYWFALADWLHHRTFEVVLVNPLTTKRNKENRDNRPSKNDSKDAVTIADAVSRGYYSDLVRHEDCYRRIQVTVNEREFWADKQTAIGNRLQRALDIVFPEFTAVFKDWSCVRAIATLKAFPLPSDLDGLSVDDVIKGWKQQGMLRAGGNSGRQKAAQLLATAKHSVGRTYVDETAKKELARLLQTFEQYATYLTQIDQEIQTQLGAIPPTTLHPLQAIGLSPLITAALLANAGDLGRFEHGRQLLALAGLALAECQSGKRKGQIVLSKRGRRQLRKYLYLAVLCLVANDPSFKRWHEHNVHTLKMKRQRSIFKLIGKLARILVALARNQESFDPTKASAVPLLSIAA